MLLFEGDGTPKSGWKTLNPSECGMNPQRTYTGGFLLHPTWQALLGNEIPPDALYVDPGTRDQSPHIEHPEPARRWKLMRGGEYATDTVCVCVCTAAILEATGQVIKQTRVERFPSEDWIK